ncbi:GatB/YqeY domain-containing protein [Gammaproteobacteria bacterium]|nr:GatB/YqeY domain-containing protein [Gammaproteobacteria bacterium]
MTFTLKERIVAEMKEAMRAKEAVRLDTIRLLRAAIQRREIDERVELGDEEVLAVIQKMIKQGRDSITQFEQGARDDLVQKEATMLAVLETYLPEQLAEGELTELINKALNETDAQSVRDMGKVMGWLKPHVQGRADMGTVSNAIKQKLSA